MRIKIIITFILLAVYFGLAACGPATPRAEETADGDMLTTDSGLQYVEIEAGDGPSPSPGDMVAVHYVGTLEDGTEFDNSYERGQPIEFPLGQGQVIPGWDEGIALMREGGKARLIIPSHLAYGEMGAGGIIPPDATLTFEVELVQVSGPPPTPAPPAPPAQVDEDDYITTESGLKYALLNEGNGDSPQLFEIVSIHFEGWLEDGASIGSSRVAGQTVQFIVGEGEIMPGWDELVLLMQVGDVVQAIIPPELAFGEFGAGNIIPPNATLIFEIELLDILPPPPTPTPAPPPTSLSEESYTVTDSGLKYALLEEGSGQMPEPGQIAVVHYRGWLEDGRQFDTSYDHGQPFEVPVGIGQVIPGWDEALLLLRAGDKAQIIIPPELAYGETGAPGIIPPNATLIFEIELLEVR